MEQSLKDIIAYAKDREVYSDYEIISNKTMSNDKIVEVKKNIKTLLNCKYKRNKTLTIDTVMMVCVASSQIGEISKIAAGNMGMATKLIFGWIFILMIDMLIEVVYFNKNMNKVKELEKNGITLEDLAIIVGGDSSYHSRGKVN